MSSTPHDKGFGAENTSPKGLPKAPKLLFRRFQNDFLAVLEENRILRVTSFASMMATVLCLGVLMTQGDRTRTIVVPFSAGAESLWITGNQPSDEYLRAIARDTVSLLGTFTGSSAEHQFEQLLKYVHPSSYESLRLEWRQLATDLRSYREVSFATYVRSNEPISVYPEYLDVPATRIRFIGRTKREENGRIHISYLIENGRFWLTGYNFVAQGTDRVSTSTN